MVIVSAAWGFGDYVFSDRESFSNDLEALYSALKRPWYLHVRDVTGVDPYQRRIEQGRRAFHTGLEPLLRRFFTRMRLLPDYLHCRKLMDIRLKVGDGFVQLKQPYSDDEYQNSIFCYMSGERRILQNNDTEINPKFRWHWYKEKASPCDADLAKLLLQEWVRTSKMKENKKVFAKDEEVDPRIEYSRGVSTLDSKQNDSQEEPEEVYGVFKTVKAPSIRMGQTFMPLADMVRAISRSAMQAIGGINPYTSELALCLLFSFTGHWKEVV